MWRSLVVLVIIIARVHAYRYGALRKSGIKSHRLHVLPDESARVFEPVFTPAQPIALGTILFFGIVQLRLNKASTMADEVVIIDKSIKELEMQLEVRKLEADDTSESKGEKERLLTQLMERKVSMESQIDGLRTLFNFGETNVKFRSPPAAGSLPPPIQQQEIREEGEGMNENVEEEIGGTRESFRIVIATCVTLALANLLSMLSTDPVTSVKF